MKEQKDLFRISLINVWYVIVTLIFILMRITNIIDWSPLWILSPLWIPIVLCLSLFILVYMLKYIVLGIFHIIDKFTHHDPIRIKRS